MSGTEIVTPIEERCSRSVSKDKRHGWTGRKIFICDWSDVNNTAIPSINDSFDTSLSWIPTQLICTNIQAETIDIGRQARITCTYSTDGKVGDNYYERSMEFSSEVLNSTSTMTWETAGTPVDIPISSIHPTCDLCLNIKKEIADYNLDDIWDCVGKVNDRKWMGSDKETILFIGVSVREGYDATGRLVDANLSYKFTRKGRSWNQVWREARQKLIEGIPQYYQHDNATKPYYVSDINLDSTPVYVGGADGTAGWDKPSYLDSSTTRYMYETADLAGILGLPTLAGDGI